MANNPFDVTQGTKGPQAHKFAPPAATASAASAAQAPATEVEEAPAQPTENPEDLVTLGANPTTESVPATPPPAAPPQLPPQALEIEQRVNNLSQGNRKNELLEDLACAQEQFESGNYAEAAEMYEAIDAYLSLLGEINDATGLNANKKIVLRTEAFEEYDRISDQITNGEEPEAFDEAEALFLEARCKFYDKKNWGENFEAFVSHIETALENGNADAARFMLNLCDSVLAAKQTIKQLSQILANNSLPEELQTIYEQARTQLRAEVSDILAGSIGEGFEHAQNAGQLLNSAEETIGEINAEHLAQAQQQYRDKATELLEDFGESTEVYEDIWQALGDQGSELCGLYETVQNALDSGHFDEAAVQALADLGKLIQKGVNRLDSQRFYAGIHQIHDYLAQVSEAHGSSGSMQIQALRSASAGTIGFGNALTGLQHQAASNGLLGVDGMALIANQQSNYQILGALESATDPEAKAAILQQIQMEFLDLSSCENITDLAVLLDNLMYLRETGNLPSTLQTPESMQAFLDRIVDHPIVNNALTDVERGKIVQLVEAIVIVIASAATAQMAGGLIAAELGIGGGISGFLLTNAIVAPIFTAVNGTLSAGAGLTEWWDSPQAFLTNAAIDYGMFVALGAVCGAYARAFNPGQFATLGQQAVFRLGGLATEYLAFNGYSFAIQATEAAFSEELTLDYVFSEENVRQVFIDNAVFLVGLKIGNFLASPLLSPMHQAMLEGARPELSAEVRQLETRSAALAEKIAEFQVNGGEGSEYIEMRAEQISVLEARVDLLRELKEFGFATEAEVREAEAALESAQAEYNKIEGQGVEQAVIEAPVSGDVTGVISNHSSESPVLSDVSYTQTIYQAEISGEFAAAYSDLRSNPTQRTLEHFIEVCFKSRFNTKEEANAAWSEVMDRKMELFHLSQDATSEFYQMPIFEIDARLKAQEIWAAPENNAARVELEARCAELGIEATPESVMNHILELSDSAVNNPLFGELKMLRIHSQALELQSGTLGTFGIQAEWITGELTLAEGLFTYDLIEVSQTGKKAKTAPATDYAVVMQEGNLLMIDRATGTLVDDAVYVERSADGQVYRFKMEVNGQEVIIDAGMLVEGGKLALMGGYETYDQLCARWGVEAADKIVAFRELLLQQQGITIDDSFLLHNNVIEFDLASGNSLGFRFISDSGIRYEIVRLSDGRTFLVDSDNRLIELRDGEPLLFRADPQDPNSGIRLIIKVESGKVTIQDSTAHGILYEQNFKPVSQEVAVLVAPALEPLTVEGLASTVPDIQHINNEIIAHEVGTIAPGIERPAATNGQPGSLLKISGRQVIMVGDLHGNVENLNLILAQYGEAIRSGEVVLVFLGDAIHPENGALGDMTSSIQLMDAILNLKAQNPESVFYLQGNHDVAAGEGAMGFSKGGVFQGVVFEAALSNAHGETYTNALQQFYEGAPLALVIEGPNGNVLASHALGVESNVFGQVVAAEGSLEAALINARSYPGLVKELTWTRPGYVGENKQVFDLNGYATKYNNTDMQNMVDALGLPSNTLKVNGHSHNPTGDEMAAYAPNGIDNTVTLMSSYDHSLSVIVVNADGSATVVDLAGQSPIGGMTFGTPSPAATGSGN